MIKIRKVNENDLYGVYNLYVSVTTKHPTKMTQDSSEIRLDYIRDEVIGKSMKYGLMLVAENTNNKEIIGISKAYTSPYKSLAHVMTNVTLMSTTKVSGSRIFVMLAKEFIKTIKKEYKHIYKLEIVPHSSNKVVIKFHLNNGFEIDGILKNKIFNPETDNFEDEIILGWINPNFNMEALKKYHAYLKECMDT